MMNATTALSLHKNADLAVTSVSRRPRAIVVVLGWTGATVDQLSRYTSLYHALDCSTISTAPPLLVKDTAEWAVSISREAARLVCMAHMSEMGMANVPILIHVFGTGGICLVEELSQCLEQYVGTAPCLERSVSYPSRSSSRGMSMRKLNASTRSLFTNDTEPLSDDDDDDTEDGDSSESETSVGDCSPHSISDSTPRLRRCPSTTTALSTSLSKEESTCHRGPSVSRVDLERHGLNLNQAYNPDDRACRRDLQLCASHLHTMLWDDMGPCRRNEMSLWTWLWMALLYAWQLIKQWLVFGSTNVANNNKAASEKHDGTPSLTLTRKHAFVYNSTNATSSHELMRRANSLDLDISGRCQLQGRGLGFSQKRYANEDYATFVTKVVDTVAPVEDEDDGWESEDEDSQTS